MTTSRQIAIDVREWKSGTSTGIARVITGFVTWASTNTPHRLVLFGNQHTELRANTEGVVAQVEPESSRLLWDQLTLPRLLAESEADVFLSPYYKGPLRAPCPVVVTANDLIELHHPGGSRLKRLILPPWMRLMSRRASRVLTLSEYSRRDLVETLGVDGSRIGVVPVGIDERFFDEPPTDRQEETRRGLGLPSSYVLYVGRCADHKNVRTLVRAWSALPEPLRRSHPLVLAGGDADMFRALADASDVPVCTPGFIDDDDLPALYRGAAAMCFPSLYEGFGLPPLEAMACETPVVASSATSLPEVLGDAALLVDPLDEAGWSATLARILRDGGLRKELMARGSARARRYTTARAAEIMLQNLLAVVPGGSP